MINDCEKLDPRFVEGLTEDRVDDIFIARMFWESFDYITPLDMTWSFIDYFDLDTWEKVYDKTYACIFKMVENKLVECSVFEFVEYSPELLEPSSGLVKCDPPTKIVTGEDILADKEQIYLIMDRNDTPGEGHPFLFDITWKGFGFMKDTMRAYRPVFDELDRINQNNIDRLNRAEEEREAVKRQEAEKRL